MTNTIKNTTEYNNFIKYIKDNKEGINENQTIEIEVSEKTRIDTVELTIVSPDGTSTIITVPVGDFTF